MIAVYIIWALIGIGLIIFIHEAGHFMAAKKVGVRVERFAIGFDPPFRGRNLRFFTFRRGETEYVVGMIPFGGYVKMAGETLMAGDGQGKPDELISKSVGARALVFAAGAIMNILSAFVFFIIAFKIGVSFIVPEIGETVPGAPAWEAGLRPGDRVLEIDGEPIKEQKEIRIGVALGDPSESLSFKIQRPQPSGEPTIRTVTVTPRWNEETGFLWIGTIPPFSDELGEPEAGSPAALAGVRKGDRVAGLEVDGVELPEIPVRHLFEILTRLPPQLGFRLRVLRGDASPDASPDASAEEPRATPLWLTFPPRKDKIGELIPLIGVQQPEGGNVVRDLRPDSEAAAAGIFERGDVIVQIDETPVNTVGWLDVAKKSKAGNHELKLRILNSRGEPREERVETRKFLNWILQADIHWDQFAATIPHVDPQSSLATAGVEEHDRVVSLGGDLCYTPAELRKTAEQRAVVNQSEVGLLRGNRILTVSLSRNDIESLVQLAKESLPPLQGVVDGGPAAAAGIGQGAVILSVGSDTIGQWSDLQDAVRKHEVGDRVLIHWRTTTGETKKAAITIGARQSEPIGLAVRSYKQTTPDVGMLEAFTLGFNRTIVVSKWVFLTLRSLVRRQVSPKHLSGPVGITQLLTHVSEQESFGTLLYWLALISVNLGLFNLLPFPVLDGGHLTFLLIEKIKGSPVDVRIQEWATNIAFLLILALAVFVTFHDVMRLM